MYALMRGRLLASSCAPSTSLDITAAVLCGSEGGTPKLNPALCIPECCCVRITVVQAEDVTAAAHDRAEARRVQRGVHLPELLEDVAAEPFAVLAVGHQVDEDAQGLAEPRGLQERRVAAPAVRVGLRQAQGPEQPRVRVEAEAADGALQHDLLHEFGASAAREPRHDVVQVHDVDELVAVQAEPCSEVPRPRAQRLGGAEAVDTGEPARLQEPALRQEERQQHRHGAAHGVPREGHAPPRLGGPRHHGPQPRVPQQLPRRPVEAAVHEDGVLLAEGPPGLEGHGLKVQVHRPVRDPLGAPYRHHARLLTAEQTVAREPPERRLLGISRRAVHEGAIVQRPQLPCEVSTRRGHVVRQPGQRAGLDQHVQIAGDEAPPPQALSGSSLIALEGQPEARQAPQAPGPLQVPLPQPAPRRSRPRVAAEDGHGSAPHPAATEACAADESKCPGFPYPFGPARWAVRWIV
mmetsp:Transcript_91154/g.258139  ORF Transcript_91154/g.258139 Transcript_91154/m.258139 type:complete len:464 (+) Transcript_91154:25-1416(+)